jgi:hypothetical protein
MTEWMLLVKKVMKEKGCSFKEALVLASKIYKK